jgi:DNA-binding transcriptional LysR family regulator
MNLRGIDLNLLPILAALLREVSVSGAARRLGLSQPATSHALTRLRHLLDDPLLVRFGAKMRLTDRARELLPLCEEVCAAIEAVVVKDAFDPSAATLSFSIATPDYLALLLGQELLPVLRGQAPGISVRMIDVGSSVREQLMSGAIDMAVIAFIPGIIEGLSFRRGFIDPLVCVMLPGHPAARRGVKNWADIAQYSRLLIDGTPDLLMPAPAADRTEQVSLAASHLMVLPLLAARSNSLAIVPRFLAMQAQQWSAITFVEIEEGAKNLDYCLVWHPGRDLDRGHGWLRGVLGDALNRNFPPQKGAEPTGFNEDIF